MRTLFLQLLVIYSTQALEQPIRASFLQPRNFNPHPYQIEPRNFLIHAEEPQAYAPQKSYEQLSRQFQNTGPIQFPPNLEDAAQPTQQQLDQQRRVTSHIVDQQALIPRPYEKLAKQYRAQQLHRYKGVQVAQSPRTFSALANHARKIQGNHFQQNPIQFAIQHNSIDDEYVDPIKSAPSNNEKKQYQFSYAVKDGHSGDDFSHSQKQVNGAVQGSYKVQLPDGRVQIVKYTADDVHGYRADVSYENEPPAHPTSPQLYPVHVSQTHPIHVPSHATSYPKPYYPVKQVEFNSPRYTVTPTPYIASEYLTNVRAPSASRLYATTAGPRHY